MRITCEVVTSVTEHCTNACDCTAFQVDDTEVRQTGLAEDYAGDYQDGACNDCTQRIGERYVSK